MAARHLVDLSPGGECTAEMTRAGSRPLASLGAITRDGVLWLPAALAAAACVLCALGSAVRHGQRVDVTVREAAATAARDGATIGQETPPTGDAPGTRAGNGYSMPYVETLLATARWGYLDTAGRVVITARFQDAKGFSEGLAAVKLDGKWGFASAAGQMVVPATYDAVGTFSDGLAAVKLNGNWGYIDSSGASVVEPRFAAAEAFHGGRALVKLGGKFGYIDVRGTLVIPPQYTYASEFSEGLATVDVDGQRGYIDAAGTPIIRPQFASSVPFHEGLALVMVKSGGAWRFIDTKGNFAFEGAWYSAWSFSEGRALVRAQKQGPYGFIDSAGGEVIVSKYWEASPFSEGLAHVSQKSDETGLWGYIDPMRNPIFEHKHIYAPFHNGRAPFQTYDPNEKRPMGSWGFVNSKGITVIPAKLEWAREFSEGLAPFAVDCNHEAVRRMQKMDPMLGRRGKR